MASTWVPSGRYGDRGTSTVALQSMDQTRSPLSGVSWLRARLEPCNGLDLYDEHRPHRIKSLGLVNKLQRGQSRLKRVLSRQVQEFVSRPLLFV